MSILIPGRRERIVKQVGKILIHGDEASISLENLEQAYQSSTYGSTEPTLGLCSPRMLSYIKSRLQTPQRFEATSPSGFVGLKFHNSTIIADENMRDSDGVDFVIIK